MKFNFKKVLSVAAIAALGALVTAIINNKDEFGDWLESASDDEQPKEVIKNMCNHLIQKYGSKEVRSEQD